ncbi:hypothetical protein PRIPAC_88920, partial [Pristionchus pacificus]
MGNKLFQSMLLIILLSLVTSAQAWRTAYASVEGTVVCDSKNGHSKALLSDVTIQLWEWDAWPLKNDMLNKTKTTKDGEFSITGSSSEMWGDDFFIEIKVPCSG